jgi:hypothetical protein
MDVERFDIAVRKRRQTVLSSRVQTVVIEIWPTKNLPHDFGRSPTKLFAEHGKTAL